MSDHGHHHHHDHSHETHPHQLQPPHAVFHDPQAGEIVRAWIIQGQLSLAMHALAFGKAEVWGHVLAGMAKNAAAACAEGGQGTVASNLEDIRKAIAGDLAAAAAQVSVIAKT